MKRRLLLFIMILIITGCKHESIDVVSNIEKEGYFLSIQQPIFNIDKLDNKISNDINMIEKEFENDKEENDELNIDFKYQIVNDRYISVLIIVTTYQPSEKTTIYTYFFDKKKNVFLSLKNIVQNQKNLKKRVKQEFKEKYGKTFSSKWSMDKFYISKNYLNFYILSDRVYLIQIPLEEINFQFAIVFEEIKKTTPINNIEKNIIDMNKPVIALTFDDGPSQYTNEILDILKENEACATFFVLGNKVSYYQETLLKTLENGNEIGNHTYNHKWLPHLDEVEIKSQITKTQEIILKYTGFLPTLFRPSYGDIPKKVQKEMNMEVILWNVDTLDWKLKNKNKIVKRATNNVKDGDIILLHDTYTRTKDALPEIIQILKEKGFQFVTISELQEIKKLKEYHE